MKRNTPDDNIELLPIDNIEDNDKNVKKKRKSNNIFVFTTIGLLISTFVLAAALILSLKKNSPEAVEAVVEKQTLNDEELNAIREEGKQEIYSDIKNRLTNGSSTIGVIKSYFPNHIVYVNNKNQYVFQEINRNLKPNTLKNENFKQDEDGVITYVENNNVVSHMGVDASRFQGSVDFSKLKKQGVEFAILRCGYRSYGGGILNKDASFTTFVTDALKNDISVGTYFFSSAINKEEAIEEANYVLDIIKPYNITYPVVLDFEEISGEEYRQENLSVEEVTEIVIAFCETIEKAGYTPMIYSNLKGFADRMDLSKLEKYEKWFAYYSDTPYFPYEFGIWQYADSGKLDGVSGTSIDLNISFKDYSKK